MQGVESGRCKDITCKGNGWKRRQGAVVIKMNVEMMYNKSQLRPNKELNYKIDYIKDMMKNR